jgi:hypothetical protein
MNPNLNHSQVVRGPGKTSDIGGYSAVVDLKCMVKVVNAVLVLHAGRAAGMDKCASARGGALPRTKKPDSESGVV